MSLTFHVTKGLKMSTESIPEGLKLHLVKSKQDAVPVKGSWQTTKTTNSKQCVPLCNEVSVCNIWQEVNPNDTVHSREMFREAGVQRLNALLCFFFSVPLCEINL